MVDPVVGGGPRILIGNSVKRNSSNNIDRRAFSFKILSPDLSNSLKEIFKTFVIGDTVKIGFLLVVFLGLGILNPIVVDDVVAGIKSTPKSYH